MPNNTDTLPKAGQHVIARRGTSRLEGIVKEAHSSFPLIVLSLPDSDAVHSTDYDLWTKDGWTFEVITEGVLA